MTIFTIPERAFCYAIANFHEKGHVWLSTACNLSNALAAHRWYRNPKLAGQFPGFENLVYFGGIVEIGCGVKNLLERFSLLPSLNPTEWNAKQCVYLSLGTLAICTAGYAAVRVLRRAQDYLSDEILPPRVRRLDFFTRDVYLARLVLNTALACFSSHRLFYLCNTAAISYSLFTLSKLKHLTFLKIFRDIPIHKIFFPKMEITHPEGILRIHLTGENSLRNFIYRGNLLDRRDATNIHTEIAMNYKGLFFPYTGPIKKCSVCDEKPDTYFCANHGSDLTCIQQWFDAKIEGIINFKLVQPILDDNAAISITNEDLPYCPECRSLPPLVDFNLCINSNLTVETSPYPYLTTSRRNRTIPVKVNISPPLPISSFFSQTFLDGLSVAYNTFQAALVTMQHLHPELAAAIFTAQKVLLIADILLLVKNYVQLSEKIKDKIPRKYTDFYFWTSAVTTLALAAIAGFAVYRLNSRIIPPFDLKEIMKKIDPLSKVEWNIPVLKNMIECVYINRLAVNVASTLFVSKGRLPIHLMNIGLQAFSLFKFSTLLLPFIKLNKNFPEKYNTIPTFYFTLPVHVAEKPCPLNEQGHVYAALKSIHDYCSNFFKKSSWERREVRERGIHLYDFWKVTVQPPSLNPAPCGLVPIFNGVTGMGRDEIHIVK